MLGRINIVGYGTSNGRFRKSFLHCFFWRFLGRFLSDRVKKLAVYFGLYESSLNFCRRENKVNTVHVKSI